MNTQHAETAVANLALARAAKQTPEVTAFADACVWTGARDSDRDSWLEFRRELITASDVAALMGEHPYKDAFDVYVDKVTPRAADEPLTLSDPRFWGKVLELPIAHAVADHYGWEIRDGGYLLRSRAHPMIGCTLDAEVRRTVQEGWLPWEGKTSRITKEWSEEDGNLPTHILIQAQVQLLVTQAPRDVVFGLLQGSRPVQVDVERYADYHAVIVEQCEWMVDLVRRGEPPTPTARSAESLRRLFPDSDGASVRLPIEAVEWTREVQEVSEQITQFEARKEELRNMLRQAIGSATYGELAEPVGGKSAWKYGVIANGNRPLLQVKSAPGAARNAKSLLEAPVSLKALPEAELITQYRKTTTRRKARR